ncbi:acyl carrier protein [Aquabacterium sp.]|uniref:acyl carrier protein n=1 Tax=Aquabacterium sp. TaxID=1872578 RepID=UPI0035B0367C
MLNTLIKNYLIDNAKVEANVFDRPDLMVADLALDSLGMVEMLFEIEDRFGFQIDEPMRFRDMRFDDMVKAIEDEVRSHHGGELPDLEALGASAGRP